MKKSLSILSLFFCALVALSAQTIVSTSTQNKKAVFEEYGGIYCVYCPEGNQIAEAIINNNPDNILRINIQEGLYSTPEGNDPDFRSDFGQAYLNQTGLIGYPAGTVNRMVFPNIEQGSPGTTALGRNHWNVAIQQVLDQTSIVNVAATAMVDFETSELEIFVEIYYTGSSNNPINYLNIALLQNQVHGPQAGSNLGQNYIHNHLLRDMITGQWGDPIYNTDQGHFESRTYTYQLPAEYREVPFDSPNMELAIFITESHQNILNGVSVFPEFTVQNTNDANALFLQTPETVCGNQVAPVFTLRNEGNEPLTSLDIEYWVNNETPLLYEWTGELNTFDTEEIVLPAITFDGYIGEENLLHVSIQSPNNTSDENYNNNETTTPFFIAPPVASSSLTLELKTDGFGYDIYWEILDEDNNLITYGGNENVGENGGGTQTALPSDPGAYNNNITISEPIELPGPGCYKLRILDDYGDGMCCQYGYGFYYLQDEDGNIIFTGGEFGDEQIEPFSFGTSIVAIEDTPELEAVKAYPNPVTNDLLNYEINIHQPEMLKVELFASDNRISYSTTESISASGLFSGQINVQELPSGIYFLKLTTDQGSTGRKIVLLR